MKIIWLAIIAKVISIITPRKDNALIVALVYLAATIMMEEK